jgi:hypothetical protein
VQTYFATLDQADRERLGDICDACSAGPGSIDAEGIASANQVSNTRSISVNARSAKFQSRYRLWTR